MLAFVVADNDPAAIGASIARVGWRLALLLCFPISLVTLFDTLGWRFAFSRDRVGLGTLVPARRRLLILVELIDGPALGEGFRRLVLVARSHPAPRVCGGRLHPPLEGRTIKQFHEVH